jgi:flagellar L-ring protein precursor FlgH
MRSPARRSALGVMTSALMALPLGAQAAPPATAAATPANAALATTAAAPAAVSLPAPRQSWYADRRTFAVGDIITVLIDDYTITTAIKENIASDTRSRDLGLQANLPSSSKNIGLDTRNDATQNVKGSAKRENRFQNEMSVRVMATGANGLLQVKGTKNINVDKNIQDIVLTGWVRAQDISAQNMVESARIADAQIGYASPGNLTKPKQGIMSKILGAFWP